MKAFRNASSLLLVAKNNLLKNSKSNANDINVLALKRSTTASHFPDSYVFPGGNCDPADEIPDWLELFPASELDVQLNVTKNDFDLPDNSAVPQAISRRITAIRETFEESGILLCRQNTDPVRFLASDFDPKDKDSWRSKIRNNAVEFYNFCRAHNCFPNLKSLHFLSCWISPPLIPKRFNSKFFIAALDHEIASEPDFAEIQEVKWESLNYLIENKNVYLPPPQMYELFRLQAFENFDSLCDFMGKLDGLSCDPYLPIRVNTSDGSVMMLPGDEKYNQYSVAPVEYTVDLDCDIASFRGKVMNRVEYKDVDKPDHCSAKGEVVIENFVGHRHHAISLFTQSKL